MKSTFAPHQNDIDQNGELPQAAPRRTLKRRSPASLALEPRVMFDGATADAAVLAAKAAVAEVPADLSAERSVHQDAQVAAAVQPPAPARHEIVFVEDNVSDFQALVASVPSGTEVVVLDHTRDGLQQMVEALDGHAPVDAIHLVTHGSAGQIELGTNVLDSATLDSNAGALAQLGSKLSAGGDLLIYGCDVAAGSEGQALVERIGQLTGADVAASTDLTGSSAYGNWTLEAQRGDVTTATIELDRAGWTGELDTVTTYNANWQMLTFSNVTSISGSGTGKTGGDVMRFNSVITLNGQAIDAVVTTAISGTRIDTYDSTSLPSGVASYFQPTLTTSAVGGNATFTISFYKGGTYTGAGTGTAVTLQNVVVNSYDIDSTGGADRQFQSFKGFARYELSNSTELVPTVQSDGSVTFLYTTNSPQNNGTVTADPFRVRVFYDSMSTFQVNAGVAGTTAQAYFAFDFSIGPDWSGPKTTFGNPAPILSYSSTSFAEAAANDGSITATSTITLANGTFSGSNGQELSGVSFSNVPAGLSAHVTRTSATTAVLSFTGNANAHANANDIGNLGVTFGNAAFASGNAGAVTGTSRADLAIDFTDPPADTALPVVAAGQTFSYAENRGAGTVVGLVAASDNVGVTGFRFAATGTATSADGYYSIANDGRISLTATGAAAGAPSNDYEKAPNSFTHAVQARDAAGNWSAGVDLDLGVTNIDEQAPLFTSGTTAHVPENQAVLYTAAANDTVDYTNRVVSYSLKAGAGDAALLSIDANSGVVSLANGNLDAGIKSAYVFTVIAQDATGNAREQAVSVAVDSLNQAPVGAGDSIVTAEDTVYSGTLPTATDADGDSLSYSKATDPQHGSVQVGANGAYTYTPSANYNGTDSFSYTVSDGKGGSNTYTVSVNVTPVNDAPVGAGDSIVTAEDTAYTGTLPTATDADGDSLSYSKAADPQHGSVQVGANGAYTYTPAANYNGTDSFTYTVSDGHGGNSTYTVSVNVTPVNDAPVGAGDSIVTAEGTAYTGTLPTATDADGDSITYAKAGDPQHGSVQVGANGAYTYTPAANYNGSDSFSYTVSDGHGGSNTYTVSVNVTPVNDAPVGASDSIVTAEDTAYTGTLPAATDADGDSLSYSKATDPQHGSVQVGANGAYTYTPAANYSGSDAFSYTVSDGHGGSNIYTVSVNVTPVNDAPVGAGDSIVTAEDAAYTGTLPTATDADGDTVSYAKASDPQHGAVQVGANGSYTYTPAANYNGADSFTYTVNDGQGGSNTYTVSVNVTPANDAPVGANDSIVTAEDTAYTGTLPAATDVDGDTVSYARATDPQHGSVQVGANGSYTYTPGANYNGADSFTYTVNDGQGGSNTYTVSVNVTPANDAPVGANDSIVTAEDTAYTGTLPAATDTDGDKVGYARATDPQHGSVQVGANGSYTYTPAADYNGADSFSYTVSDGKGGSNTYTVSIDVTPVNDAPVAHGGAAGNGIVGEPIAPVQVPVFTDVDGPATSYTATLADGKPLPAWLVFDPATLRFTGTPPAGSAGTLTVLVTGSDGALSASANVTITVADPALPGQSLSIASMTKDTGASPTDFVTNDGSAGRTVSGSIGAPLGRNEAVQVSFDRGATWTNATVSGTSWTAVDTGAHAGNWAIEARVANTAAGLNGPATAREVVLDTLAPTAPTVDDVTTTSTTPVLSGTATVGTGETLLVSVDGATYEVSAQGGRWTLDLASARPVSGNAASLSVGQKYDVTATVTDLAGNARSGANTGTLAVSPPPVQDTPPAAPAVAPAAAPVPETVQAPAPVAEATPVGQAVDSRVNSSSAAPGSLAAGDTVLFGSGQGTRSNEDTPVLDLRGAALSDVYTRTEGFRTVVAKAEEPALVLFQGVPDQYADAGTRLSLSVPADAFAHTQPKAIVRLTAVLQDGKPLPAWVEFNGQTGQFTGEVPKGLKGELKIKLVARDLEGREATALFRINVGQNRNTSGTPQADAKAAPAGKPGLSAQLRAARRG